MIQVTLENNEVLSNPKDADHKNMCRIGIAEIDLSQAKEAEITPNIVRLAMAAKEVIPIPQPPSFNFLD